MHFSQIYIGTSEDVSWYWIILLFLLASQFFAHGCWVWVEVRPKPSIKWPNNEAGIHFWHTWLSPSHVYSALPRQALKILTLLTRKRSNLEERGFRNGICTGSTWESREEEGWRRYYCIGTTTATTSLKPNKSPHLLILWFFFLNCVDDYLFSDEYKLWVLIFLLLFCYYESLLSEIIAFCSFKKQNEAEGTKRMWPVHFQICPMCLWKNYFRCLAVSETG